MRPTPAERAESKRLARAFARKLRPDTTAHMSDNALDADPVCTWMEACINGVRAKASGA